MPASNTAILKNVERLKDDALIELWNSVAKPKEGDEPTLGQAWASFVETADQLKLAGKIPGSVGTAFRKRYADEARVETKLPEKTAAPAARQGSKAPRARKAASGPAPATTGSKAGGSGQRRPKAAQSAKKEAAK